MGCKGLELHMRRFGWCRKELCCSVLKKQTKKTLYHFPRCPGITSFREFSNGYHFLFHDEYQRYQQMIIIPRLFFYRCFWEFTDWFPLTGQENTILKEFSLLLRMNALQRRVHAGKSLFLFFFCFRFPWGLHTSWSGSPVPWGSTQPVTGREGPELHGQGGGELRLLCVWASHFVFSSAHVCHSWALGIIHVPHTDSW